MSTMSASVRDVGSSADVGGNRGRAAMHLLRPTKCVTADAKVRLPGMPRL